MRYLEAYGPEVQAKVLNLLAQDRVGDYLQPRYGQAHEARNDRALFQMAVDLKDRFMRNTPPLQKAMYDSQL